MRHMRLLAVLYLFGTSACGTGSNSNVDIDNSQGDTRADSALADVEDVGPSGQDAGDADSDELPDLVAPGPTHGFCEPNSDPLPERPPIVEPPTLPWLKVQGTDIVDDQGIPVALRGFNFGSWLAIEDWITGFGEISEDELLAQLEDLANTLGLGDLYQKAKAQNGLEWMFETRTHWDCIQEWRIFMQEQATEAQVDKVAELWAWFDKRPWLLEEESIWLWLEGRFGYQKTWELRQVYQDNYLTELDFKRLSDLGLNFVRLPVWYQNLETDFVGDNHYRPEGWQRLHQAALWARKYKIYILLDLHGAPGGQSAAPHQGLRSGSKIWASPKCTGEAARIWKAMANFFKDDPHVFAYDLLNEPMSCPNREAFETVHKALYAAIREVDPRHIVAVEDGYRSEDIVSSPSEMGMENAVFAFHFYPWGVDSAEKYMSGSIGSINFYLSLFERYQCPLLATEFSASAGSPGEWTFAASDQMLDLLNRRGIHWALWSWKFRDESNIWGLYNPKGDARVAIPMEKGTYDEIRGQFEALNSENYETFPKYEATVRERAQDPLVPLNPAPIDPLTYQ